MMLPQDMDHYELLEIPRGASPEEVERAWRLMRQAYDRDSLGIYSVVDEDELDTLRARIDAAYRVLSDPAARSAYDASAPRAADPGLPTEPEPTAADGTSGELRRAAGPVPRPAPAPAAPVAPNGPGSFEVFEAGEDEPEGEWDGARLRRARMVRGVEIEQVAAVTKVNPSYLRFLEEEAFESLPAPVYVRGFVVSVAKLLGLDADRVARSYMKRLEEWRTAPRRTSQPGA